MLLCKMHRLFGPPGSGFHNPSASAARQQAGNRTWLVALRGSAPQTAVRIGEQRLPVLVQAAGSTMMLQLPLMRHKDFVDPEDRCQ
jgi:hypothetical protein